MFETKKSTPTFVGNLETEPKLFILKRIGSTTYKVGVHFSGAGNESLNEKILRLVKNDLHFSSKNVIMALPQVNQLPEGSSA